MSLSIVISGRLTKSGDPFRGIDALREMVIDKKIWYSKPNNFNDPFEFKSFKCVGIKNFQKTEKQIKEPSLSYGESVLSRCGIICFCNNSSDIRMWSHYADGHRGICIRFKCEASSFFDNRLYNVTYNDNITEFEIDLNKENENYFLRQASTKALCWQYEDEYRIVNPSTTLTASDGYGLKSFPSELIEGIIFGLKTSYKIKTEIKKIIAEIGTKINLYKAIQIPDQLKLMIVKGE
jgi:hypothetical protein